MSPLNVLWLVFDADVARSVGSGLRFSMECLHSLAIRRCFYLRKAAKNNKSVVTLSYLNLNHTLWLLSPLGSLFPFNDLSQQLSTSQCFILYFTACEFQWHQNIQKFYPEALKCGNVFDFFLNCLADLIYNMHMMINAYSL